VSERNKEGGGRGLLGGFFRSLLAGIPWSERAESMDSLRLKRPPEGAALHIDNGNGRTCVRAEDREDILVEAHKSARAENQEEAKRLLEKIRVAASESAEGLHLLVEIPRRWNRHGQVNLELRVPRELTMQIHSSNGSVAVQGVRGRVKARSSNGSVCVRDVVGDMDLATSNGKVSCAATRGRLVARSSNRKIEIEQHSGSLDAMTSNGTIHASIQELGPEGVVLATSNGRIVLDLPEEIDAELDVRVDNGVIRNHRTLAGTTRDSTGRVRGKLGRGGALIRLRTSNGSISLR
jgi:hypothetical protein